MDIRKTRTCERCRTVVLLDKVRLFPKEKDMNILVCENCCEELKEAAKPKTMITNSRIAPLVMPLSARSENLTLAEIVMGHLR